MSPRLRLLLALPFAALAACDGEPGPAPADLGTATDLSSPPDLATPPPADLAVPPDLVSTPTPDIAMFQSLCGNCHIAQWSQVMGGPHAKAQGECLACHKDADKHQADPSKIRAAIDFGLDGCAGCHADYKESYLKDDGMKAGKYGGSVKTSKYAEWPKYQHLMGGHGFTIEYNEERAHAYMLKDHIDIKRKQNVGCLQCKSTPVALFWNESRRGVPMFDKTLAWADAVQKIKDNWGSTIDYGAGCNHCHDPHTGGYRLVRKGVVNAILERGTDPYNARMNFIPKSVAELNAKLNERDMNGQLTVNARRLAGTLTCAQCHIEYTCGPGADKGPLRDDIPWRKARDIEAYYKVKYNLVQDWTHTGTGTNGIKPQHPETEFFWESTHYLAGVSCADCHMSRGGGKTSHWFTSPLKLPKDTCENCHPGEGESKLKQVIALQDVAFARAKALETDLDLVLTKIESAPAIDPAKLAEAKERFMRALFFWEWTAISENSYGFHNTTEAAANFKTAEDELTRAKALLAM